MILLRNDNIIYDEFVLVDEDKWYSSGSLEDILQIDGWEFKDKNEIYQQLIIIGYEELCHVTRDELVNFKENHPEHFI